MSFLVCSNLLVTQCYSQLQRWTGGETSQHSLVELWSSMWHGEQLWIEMSDESWMVNIFLDEMSDESWIFLESFMVSQVRMATRAPGSWRRLLAGERERGKEWSPCSAFLLWEPCSVHRTLPLWGRGKERACTVSLIIILGEQFRWEWDTNMSTAHWAGTEA